MRNITADAAIAFINNKPFSKSNTQVVVDDNEVSMLLHGNKIAWCNRKSSIPLETKSCKLKYVSGTSDEITRPKSLRFDLCGWHTVTTRERINGLLHYYAFNIKVAQRNFKPVLIQEKFRSLYGKPYYKAELKLATDRFNPSFVMKAFKIQESLNGTGIVGVNDEQ